MQQNILLFFISILVAGEAFASENITIVDAYFKQHKGGKAPQENRNFLQDECFVKANEYIYNLSKQKEMIVDEGNSHSGEKLQKVVKKFPDYEKALNALYLCVNQSENPIAAWEGLYIINTFTAGVLASKKINEFTKFSKVLYEDKSCDGFLYYGDIFGRGIGTKPDNEKALSIYEQGAETCSESWYKVVFQMRINNLKKQKK